MLLCSSCLHALDDAGFCTHAGCPRAVQVPTGYTVPPAVLSEMPDPFPQEPVSEVCCPMCGQAIPSKE